MWGDREANYIVVIILQYRCIKSSSDQIRSVAQSCPTLCDPMNRSTPGLPVHHQLPEFTETHVHRASDAIQPSHPLLSSSPPAPNPSQHQSLFQWVKYTQYYVSTSSSTKMENFKDVHTYTNEWKVWVGVRQIFLQSCFASCWLCWCLWQVAKSWRSLVISLLK